MSTIMVGELPDLEFEAGMLVVQSDDGVLCTITVNIASIIGAIF